MRIHRLLIAVLLLAVLVALNGCSDLSTPGPNPVTPASIVHPTGWDDTTGHGAGHGAALKQVDWDASSCRSCHGGTFGGGSSGVSCFSCHDPFPHSVKFIAPDSTGHGLYLKTANFTTTGCKLCHGQTYTGGNVGVSCVSCHNAFPHETQFAGIHHTGYLQARSFNTTECQKCHGVDYNGGSVVNVACYSCHPPYPHSVKFNFGGTRLSHVSYMKENTFPFSQCQKCHETDYAGGTTGVSCSGGHCHATASGQPKSPEACNTCHGEFRGDPGDTLSWAPPRDTNDDTLSTTPGVGAHQLHLVGAGMTSSRAVPCSGCHTVPTNVSDPGHYGNPGGRAIVTIKSALALTPSDGLTPAPTYNLTTFKCSGTYCHGSWQLRRATTPFDSTFYADTAMTGNFAAPVWTGGSAEAACGTCHDLPPKGHTQYPLNQCYACHSGVVNAQGQIIDKTKHMNGLIDVYGEEFSMSR